MMKIRMFTALCAIMLGTTAVLAQKGVEDGSRFGHGEDSIRCLQNISVYTEYVKTNNFKDAYTPWKAVFTEAPTAQVGTYTNGVKILRALIASAKDATEQGNYFSELMAVYDQRLKYLDQLNNLVKTKATKGSVIGLKAHDYIYFSGKAFDVNEAYNMLKTAIDMEKENSDYFILQDMMDVSSRKLKADETHKETFIQDYLITSEYAEKALKAAPENQKNIYKTAKDNVDAYFINSGAATCENLQSIYGPKIEENKNNIEYLKQVINVMQLLKCTNEDAYFAASEAAHAIEPTAGSAAGCGFLYYKKGEYDKSISYFDQAIEMENDLMKKSEYCYSAAAVLFTAKQYSKAKQYANKAIEANPNSGKSYILIAQLYASAPNWDSDPTMNKCTYFAVISKLQRAKSVDPSVTEEANRLISAYSAHTPKTEDLFFLGLKSGSTVKIGGWIGETITIP